MDKISGKGALVTGAAQGIGKAIAEELLVAGAKVCLADIDDIRLGELDKELQAKYGRDFVMTRKCDVTNTSQLEDTFKETHSRFGQLYVVVNNAGILNEIDVDLCVKVNQIAQIKGIQLGIQYMSTKDGGNGGLIVNTSSVAGLPHLYPADMSMAPLYAATKSAVIAYSTEISKLPAVRANNIRINCLCPSKADTAITRSTKMLDNKEGIEWYQSMPSLTVSTVSKAFMTFIEREDLTGACLSVTPAGLQIVNNSTTDTINLD